GTTTGGGTVVGMGGGSASGGTTGVGSTGGGTTTGGSTGSGNGGSTKGGSGNASTPDPIVTVPGTQKVASGSTIAISGASISDPWGANAPGLMALNVSSNNGTVSLKDANGNPFPGSGSTWVQVKAPLAQINAALATLSYTASGTSGSVTVDIWDQAGVEATKSFNVNVSSSAGGSTGSSGGGTNSGVTTPPGTGSSGGNNGGGTGPTGSTGPAINIAANDANPVVMASNTTIGASAGDHMIFIGGTGDTLTATGGTESVMAFQGGNKITTGAGNDTIRFAGTNSVINAGGGNNMLADSGNNNTIVLPGANKGYDDVYGWVMTNGDTFDLRGLLASTKWNGSTSAIKQYVSVDSSSGSAVINVTPSGTPGGATYKVATFEASGPVSLTTLLSHSIV
ncbi:MAG: type I secretion C-terminal target domain-containing protein, partial [Acetobacteraceae bacterium]|nr:type I secretion C-terminal target domain-containing protein [Acetobacteraceae bacterium]